MTRLLLNIMINAEFVYKIFSVVTFSYNISQSKDYIPLHERNAFLQLTLKDWAQIRTLSDRGGGGA